MKKTLRTNYTELCVPDDTDIHVCQHGLDLLLDDGLGQGGHRVLAAGGAAPQKSPEKIRAAIAPSGPTAEEGAQQVSAACASCRTSCRSTGQTSEQTSSIFRLGIINTTIIIT